MNRFTLIALVVLAIVAFVAYRIGAARGRARNPTPPASESPTVPSLPALQAPAPVASSPSSPAIEPATDPVRLELARLIRAYEAESWQARSALEGERREAADALARSHAETERYRRIVVDIENNAPPPLFDGPGTPDDLKLIVGIGPVLERMLHQLGVGSFRQIARWTERDIDALDAKLPEFPGRIRRDAWVTQARELHLAKYGERL